MTITYLDYLEVITSLGIIKICKVRRYLKFHLLVKFLLITNSFVYIITEFYNITSGISSMDDISTLSTDKISCVKSYRYN